MNAANRLGTAALLLLPGAFTVYLAFNAGGFYPNTQAFMALILAGAFALRIAFAEAPFEGYGRPVALAAGGLALFAVWTALSGAWSDAPGRAALETDRVVLYLLGLLLFASLPRSASQMQWMLRGLAAGIVVVCVCSLMTRVLPDVWPIAGTIADERLSYPVTYWNALGLLAAVGTILCFHFTCSRSEPPAVRVLGAAAVPVLDDDAVLHVLAGRDRSRDRGADRVHRDQASVGSLERAVGDRPDGHGRNRGRVRRRPARHHRPRPARPPSTRARRSPGWWACV